MNTPGQERGHTSFTLPPTQRDNGTCITSAWAEAHGLDGLSRRAHAAFLRLPRSGSYGATRFLETALRPAQGRSSSRNACYQQGLLYLYNQYCAEGECSLCPLSESTGLSQS